MTRVNKRGLAEAAIRSAIARLERDPRRPADLLLAEGLRGVCDNPWACVLSVFFNRVLADAGLGGDDGFHAYITDDRVLLVEGERPDKPDFALAPGTVGADLRLPIPYCELIEEFDLGRLPQLVAQEVPNGRRDVL